MVTLLNEDGYVLYDLLLSKYCFWNCETKILEASDEGKRVHFLRDCHIYNLVQFHSWFLFQTIQTRSWISFWYFKNLTLIAIYYKNHFSNSKFTHKNTQVKDNFVYCLLMLSYKGNILLFEFLFLLLTLLLSFICCCFWIVCCLQRTNIRSEWRKMFSFPFFTSRICFVLIW